MSDSQVEQATDTADAALPAPTEVRSLDGRWQPGQSGNPAGRPPSRRQSITDLQQRLEQAVRARIRPERVTRIVDQLCTLAEQGNVKAAQTILQYVITKPSTDDDATSKAPGAIVIRIENATFKAQQSSPQQQPEVIEGEYAEQKQAD